MNRISSVFNNKKSAFITYLVCGDPDLQTTLKIMHSMVDNGVDLIELGIPFTDPIADGPTIQKGIERALKNKVSLNDVLNLVTKFRKKDKSTPIVLMGYMNPIINMGYKKFSKLAKFSGVDGLLIVDLPPEEDDELCIYCLNQNLHFIRLLTPTSDNNRLKTLLTNSSGFLYYVSVAGVTGTKVPVKQVVASEVERITCF